jgi:hypothetical protein
MAVAQEALAARVKCGQPSSPCLRTFSQSFGRCSAGWGETLSPRLSPVPWLWLR